jgi:hypothetical protein
MLKVARVELAVWHSVARGLKLWVAQTEATAARVAIFGLWLIATLHRFWHFVTTRTAEPKMVSTAKEKIFMVGAVKI